MGWLFSPLRRSVTEEVVSPYNWQSDTHTYEAVAHSINVRKGFAFIAVKITEKATGAFTIGAATPLIRHVPTASDGYTFGVKSLDESCGPYTIECPARILDLLTPLPDAPVEGDDPHRYARQWRAACRERLAKQKADRKALREGATITLAQPVRFTDGTEKQTFTVRGYTKHLRGGKTRRAWRFLDANGCGVRLRKTLLASATII